MVEQLIKKIYEKDPLDSLYTLMGYDLPNIERVENPEVKKEKILSCERNIRSLVSMLSVEGIKLASGALVTRFRTGYRTEDDNKVAHIYEVLMNYWTDHHKKAHEGINPFIRENNPMIKEFLEQLPEESLLEDALIIDHAKYDQTACAIAHFGNELLEMGREDLLSTYFSKVGFLIDNNFEDFGDLENAISFINVIQKLVLAGNGVPNSELLNIYKKVWDKKPE